MRTETEWNYDRSACRWLVYRREELVDVTPWTVLRPNRFVRTVPLMTRALLVPLVILVLELVVLLVMKAF